jgi:hypothetical protein
MLCLPYYAYVFSSTKLEIRAETGSEGRRCGEGGSTGQGGEMTQCMHM